MLIYEFPAYLFSEDEVSVRDFEVNEQILTVCDSFTYRFYKSTGLREMFKHMAADYQVSRLIFVFVRVIVNNKADIFRNVITWLGFIARAKTNT